MNIYNRFIFPRLLDRAMFNPIGTEQRQSLLKNARGQVLEIGFGTGANLPHYDRDRVTDLSVVEPERLLPERVNERIQESGIKVHWHTATGEALPFEANHFDTVVITLTLCSVRDPLQVLREVQRVLKPEGQLLLLEHGLSPDPKIARWQHRLNGINCACGGGCNLNRPIKSLLQSAQLGEGSIEEFYLDQAPPIGGYMTRAILGSGKLSAIKTEKVAQHSAS
jgi:SAM-dependent methyltransferase